MRKPVLLIGTNALILVAIFLFLTQSLVVAQKVAHSVHQKGTVTVQRGGQGEFTSLEEGGSFRMGDVVRTGAASSAEFRWLDGTRVKLMPNSSLELRKSTYNSIRGTEDSQLKLTQGKLFVRLVKPMAAQSKFEVQTPSAVATVHGTIFSVEADPGKTEVQVYRGNVSVKLADEGDGAKNKVHQVFPGHEFTVVPYGNVQRDSRVGDADFEAEPSIVKPQLLAARGEPKDGVAVMRVESESGNTVTVDGQPAQEVDTGVFAAQIKVTGGKQSWKVVSTDKHGLSSTLTDSYVPETPQCQAKPGP